MMKRFKPQEIWNDENGNIAVLTESGDYNIYIHPGSMYIEGGGFFGSTRQVLSDTDYMRSRITSVKVQILNAIRRGE